jgi:hypothetical protein
LNWGAGDVIPGLGSGDTSFDYPPYDAINFAEYNSTTLQNYLTDNPSAYVINGYYNETDGTPRWNMTFGEFGDETGFYIIVENVSGFLSISDESNIDISEVRNSTADFSEVLSFSASEEVFMEDSVIDDNAFDASNNVKFYDGYNYGVRANMLYPSISLTVTLSMERTEYGYFISKDDGSFSAAVDAINGQLMYSWEHDGEDLRSWISP